MEPIFSYRDGELWWRDFWMSRESMERQAAHFETVSEPDYWVREARELGRECRAAIAAYDAEHVHA